MNYFEKLKKNVEMDKIEIMDKNWKWTIFAKKI